MAFSLYCLLNENSNQFSLQFLETELTSCFSKTTGFNVQYEEDPLDSSEKHLLLSWENWWIRVFYETGQHIIDDSIKIATYAEPSRARDFSNINKRIVVRFADDKSKNYTNHTILMLDYLEDIENIIIFNPHNNTFFES
ncbi:MAG: hypothetical protein KBC72_07850 [Acinetobacter sp.]|nr:hypothetical protein [Acinetobacter sp.]